MVRVATPFPDWMEPTAATLTQERFSGPDWIFERKLDGIRLLAFKHRQTVRLLSRNRLAQNATYPGAHIGADGLALLRAALADDAPAGLRSLPIIELLRQVWVQNYVPTEDRLRWRTNEDGLRKQAQVAGWRGDTLDDPCVGAAGKTAGGHSLHVFAIGHEEPALRAQFGDVDDERVQVIAVGDRDVEEVVVVASNVEGRWTM
jgi:hypothetical protein